MNKDDIRSLLTGALFFLGFFLVIGTVGKYEFHGYISAQEFLAKTAVGLAMMAAAFPVSGELGIRKEGDKSDKGR